MFNHKSSFCSGDIQIFVIFSRVASDFCNENSGTIQEHKQRWKYHNNSFEGIFKKKLNLIITKDKSHES